MKTFAYKYNSRRNMPVALLFILMMFTASCSEFLEEDPKGGLSSSTFFSNGKDLQMAVNAVYANVYEYTYSNANHVNTWAGDDYTTSPTEANKQSCREFDCYVPVENNVWMPEKWNNAWVLVKAANYVINNAAKTQGVTALEIEQAIAQAAYWRAYAYFHLVQCWGPIPLMLEEKVDYEAPLVPVDTIYNQIVRDLKLAEKAPVLWTSVPQAMNGRNVAVSEGAAKATLAYVYLSMAGWPLNKGVEYYRLAAEKAKEVIDGTASGRYYYSLLDEYRKVHSMEYNNNNPEVIMAFYFNNTGVFRGGANLSAFADLPGEINGWMDSYGELKFWKDFPDGPRKKATYASKVYANGNGIDWWDASRSVRAPYFIKIAEGDNKTEWDETKGAQGMYNGSKSHHIVRLSEVYCWYAEAVGRSGEINQLAVDVLNRVRNRADGTETNLYSMSMTPEQLAEAAYDEHGWEIAGWYWGNIAPRYNDMFRMDRVKDHFNYRRLNPEVEVAPGVWLTEFLPVSGVWSDKMMYAPYPYADRMHNPNLVRN